MAKKVVVAMSGGVDSSVAAALLKEQGYDVYGVTMRLSNRQETAGRKFGGCCGSKDLYDARSVAQALGIPHYSFDYVDKFRQSVIDYFKETYLKGETPNPCIACNRHVKFEALLEKAVALGADYLATGHYARIERHDGPPTTASGVTAKMAPDGNKNRHPPRPLAGDPSFALKKAVDPSKDQSYVLYGLGQKELSRILFPLGGLTKIQVRDIAKRFHLRTADKPDSYEICFVPNEDYRQFISEEVPAEQRPSGPIRHVDGRVLGEHKGLPFYTIGQREGLGISVGHPLYVTAVEPATHTLVVGDKEDVSARTMTVREMTWVSGQPPTLPCKAQVKIRSKHVGASATLFLSSSPAAVSGGSSGVQKTLDPGLRSAGMTSFGNALMLVQFDQPQSAVTPGQAAVFYNGDIVLGGGVIDRAF